MATFAFVDGPGRRPDRPDRSSRVAALVATAVGLALTGAGFALTRRR